MVAEELVCTGCGSRFGLQEIMLTCPACDGLLEVAYDLEEVAAFDARVRRELVGAGVAVLLFLILDFRTPRLVLMVGGTLVVGIAWMLGMMYLWGIDINVFNQAVLATIIGVGGASAGRERTDRAILCQSLRRDECIYPRRFRDRHHHR